MSKLEEGQPEKNSIQANIKAKQQSELNAIKEALKDELRAEFDKKLEDEKNKLRDEFESASDKQKKLQYKEQRRDYKAYRLTVDIMGDPKKDGRVLVAHKKGGIYFQNEAGTANVQFKYKVGDPDYFERVPEMDYHKVDKIYKLSPVG